MPVVGWRSTRGLLLLVFICVTATVADRPVTAEGRGALAGWSAPLPAWRPGVAGDLSFATSQFLQLTAYRDPDRTAADFDMNGAYGPLNIAWDGHRRGRWLIEEQRYAFDAIVVGLARHRQDLIERGRLILDWGFRREQPDGSFACPDHFHSGSFFIEAAAHSALLLEASDMHSTNQAWVDSIKPKLALAARWMKNPANEEPGRAGDAPYTHRNYLDAAAVGEVGVLINDTGMLTNSQEYIRAGIARQDPSGFNPEKGGWDTSYDCVGLLYALYYYTIVAGQTGRAQLSPMLARGMAWFDQRVGPSGIVDQRGNTRTGAGQERGPQGNLKTMSYGSAYRAAYYWAMITRDARWTGLAVRLAGGDELTRAVLSG